MNAEVVTAAFRNWNIGTSKAIAAISFATSLCTCAYSVGSIKWTVDQHTKQIQDLREQEARDIGELRTWKDAHEREDENHLFLIFDTIANGPPDSMHRRPR